MRKYIVIIIFLGLFTIGCKEKLPDVDLGEKSIILRDTSYISTSIPTSEFTRIYIEDFTAVRMNNCPRTANKIIEIRTANPSNVVSVGMYPSTIGFLTSPFFGFDTLNTDAANDIINNVYNSPVLLPAGGINRKVFANEPSPNVLLNKWSGYSDSIKSQKSPVILTGQLLNYNDNTRKARLRVKVLFTQQQFGVLNLTVYLTESKITSRQLMPNGAMNDNYVHNYVLRETVTPFNGEPLDFTIGKPGVYVLGQTFEKDIEVEIKQKWEKANCSFIVFVNRFDFNSKEVLQALEISFK